MAPPEAWGLWTHIFIYWG